jgi:hypothetical protein
MTRRRDAIEAWANAIAGLGVSVALVWLLRRAGLWDLPALHLSAAFFAASVARSFALRRLFRWWESRNV